MAEITTAELRKLCADVEAERLDWMKGIVDELVAKGIDRKRIIFDMTDDKLFACIAVDHKPVAECEIVVNRRGIRLKTKKFKSK